MALDMAQLCYGQRHVQVTILIDKMRSGMLTREGTLVSIRTFLKNLKCNFRFLFFHF